MYSFFISKNTDDFSSGVSVNSSKDEEINSIIDPTYRTYNEMSHLSKYRVFDYYDFYDYKNYDYSPSNESKANKCKFYYYENYEYSLNNKSKIRKCKFYNYENYEYINSLQFPVILIYVYNTQFCFIY